MGDSAKKALSERDICTKYITPALVASNMRGHSQMREEARLAAAPTSVEHLLDGALHQILAA